MPPDEAPPRAPADGRRPEKAAVSGQAMINLLRTLVVFLSLCVAAVGIAMLLIDPDDFRDDIERGFAAATGRPLVIDGHLEASLVPRPVLAIGEVALPGAPGAAEPPLVAIDLIRIYPRLAPLFFGRLDLELVRAQGVRVQIRAGAGDRARQGPALSPSANGLEPAAGPGAVPAGLGEGISHGTPDGIADPSKVESNRSASPEMTGRPPAMPHPPPESVGAGRPRKQRLTLGVVEVLDGTLAWDLPGSGRRLALEDLTLSAGPIAPRAWIPWRLDGALRDGNGGAPSRLQGAGRLAFDPDRGRLQIAPCELDLAGWGLREGPTADFLLRAALALDLAAGRLVSDHAALEVVARGGGLAEEGVAARIAARLDLDLRADRLEVADLSLRSGTLSARGRMAGRDLRTGPLLTGELAVDSLDLRGWLAQRDVSLASTTDPETFRRFGLQTRLRLTGDRLDLSGLALDIDETRLTGTLALVGTPPAYRFDLAADRLDLDRYLRPPAEPGTGSVSRPDAPAPMSGPVAGEAPAPEPASEPAPTAMSLQGHAAPAQVAATPASSPPAPRVPPGLPAQRPQANAGLDLEGRLHLDELILSGLRFADTGLAVRAEGGRIAIDDLVGAFYQGTLAGRLGLDLNAGEPVVRLVQHAEGVETGPLLAALGVPGDLTGRAAFTADLTAIGREPDAWWHSLAGSLAIRIDRAALRNFNLERLVRVAQARLQGRSPPADLPTDTAFDKLGASASIERGVLVNRDLEATTDHVHIRGAGTVDLARRRFDYRFEPVFVDPPRGRGIKELEGIPIPVLVTGSFDQPRWEVDLRGALAEVAERELGAQAEELLDDLEERTGIEGLGQGLKRLLDP